MSIKFKLKNFQGQIIEHEINNVEYIKNIILLTLSSDQVLLVTYEDDSQIEFDSAADRSLNFFDGAKVISLDELKTLNV